MNRDNLIAPIINRSSKLITDVDTETTTVLKNAVTLCPYHIEMIDILLVCVVEPYLIIVPIVLELPIWRRGHDQLYRAIGNFGHVTTITIYEDMMSGHS